MKRENSFLIIRGPDGYMGIHYHPDSDIGQSRERAQVSGCWQMSLRRLWARWISSRMRMRSDSPPSVPSGHLPLKGGE